MSSLLSAINDRPKAQTEILSLAFDAFAAPRQDDLQEKFLWWMRDTLSTGSMHQQSFKSQRPIDSYRDLATMSTLAHLAVLAENLEILRYLAVRHRALFSLKNRRQDTALHLACRTDNLDLVEIVCSAIADKDLLLENSKNQCGLQVSLETSNVAVNSVLLRRYQPVLRHIVAPYNDTLMHHAAKNRRFAKELIDLTIATENVNDVVGNLGSRNIFNVTPIDILKAGGIEGRAVIDLVVTQGKQWSIYPRTDSVDDDEAYSQALSRRDYLTAFSIVQRRSATIVDDRIMTEGKNIFLELLIDPTAPGELVHLFASLPTGLFQVATTTLSSTDTSSVNSEVRAAILSIQSGEHPIDFGLNAIYYKEAFTDIFAKDVVSYLKDVVGVWDLYELREYLDNDDQSTDFIPADSPIRKKVNDLFSVYDGRRSRAHATSDHSSPIVESIRQLQQNFASEQAHLYNNIVTSTVEEMESVIDRYRTFTRDGVFHEAYNILLDYPPLIEQPVNDEYDNIFHVFALTPAAAGPTVSTLYEFLVLPHAKSALDIVNKDGQTAVELAETQESHLAEAFSAFLHRGEQGSSFNDSHSAGYYGVEASAWSLAIRSVRASRPQTTSLQLQSHINNYAIYRRFHKKSQSAAASASSSQLNPPTNEVLLTAYNNDVAGLKKLLGRYGPAILKVVDGTGMNLAHFAAQRRARNFLTYLQEIKFTGFDVKDAQGRTARSMMQ